VPCTTPKTSSGTTPKTSSGTTPKISSGTTPKISSSTTPKISSGTTPKTSSITLSDGAKLREIILELLANDPYLSATKIAVKLNITRDGVRYHLQILKKNKRIKFIGKPQSGKWKVL